MKTVQANQDNDLKYRAELEEEERKKKEKMDNINESTEESTLEYFTE